MTNQKIDSLISNGTWIDLTGDNGQPFQVKLVERERSYVTYLVQADYSTGKIHKEHLG